MRVNSSHPVCCYWLTGLPGAGKSTLANAFDQILRERGVVCRILDGDDLRQGLNCDLQYSRAHRAESARRTAEVASLFLNTGAVVLVALVSPYEADRRRARTIIGDTRFVEVFVDADLKTCIERDPKGLHSMAKASVVRHFTGISDPYEPPLAAALHIDTTRQSVAQSTKVLVDHYAALHTGLEGTDARYSGAQH